MKHNVTTLSNGLRVVTAEMTEAFSATVAVNVGVGSRYEQLDSNNGVSHFLEHLLFKGTKKRPSTKIISEQIDAVGGWNNAYTSNEQTCYYVKLPYQHVELGVDILSDMIRNPLFDPDEIDRERGVVLEEMNLYRDDPASYVNRLTPSLLWPGHPLEYEVLGQEKVIQTITREAIREYEKSHYVAASMVVTAAGRVKHDEVVKLVEKYMGDMAGERTEKPVPVTGVLGGKRIASLAKDTAQTHLNISTVAYPYLHPDDATSKIITTILGRGLSSRLFVNVREVKGLAYSVTATQENFVDTGEFAVYAGVNISKTPDAIKAIIEELQTIATQPVDAAELDKAKNQIRGGLQMAMESNSAVADRMGTQLILLNRLRSVEETLSEIDAVTSDDILRVAGEMLSPGRLRLGIIAPDPKPGVAAFEEAVTAKAS